MIPDYFRCKVPFNSSWTSQTGIPQVFEWNIYCIIYRKSTSLKSRVVVHREKRRLVGFWFTIRKQNLFSNKRQQVSIKSKWSAPTDIAEGRKHCTGLSIQVIKTPTTRLKYGNHNYLRIWCNKLLHLWTYYIYLLLIVWFYFLNGGFTR